jgi:hypothetical protein
VPHCSTWKHVEMWSRRREQGDPQARLSRKIEWLCRVVRPVSAGEVFAKRFSVLFFQCLTFTD